MSWTAAFAGISAVSGLLGASKSNEMSGAQRNLLNKQAGIADNLNGISQDQYDQYNEYSGDIYDGLFDEINQGPDYEGAMGTYSADVNQAFDNMDEQQQRNNFRYGVNPSSGRAADTTRRNGIDRSLALVTSQNKARREEDDKHWARMLTGANTVQGFMNNSINAGNSAMQGIGNAANGLGNMASDYSRSAGNGMQAAGYFANMAEQNNSSNNGIPAGPPGSNASDYSNEYFP